MKERKEGKNKLQRRKKGKIDTSRIQGIKNKTGKYKQNYQSGKILDKDKELKSSK